MTGLFAQDFDTQVVHYYNVENGLSDQNILSTYRDSQGYVWICSSNSLNRFDGHSFVNYSPFSFNAETRLKGDYFCKVSEDQHGNLWGGSSAGLFRISADRTGIQYVSDTAVLDLLVDRDGDLWVCAGSRLLLYSLDKKGEVLAVDSTLERDRSTYRTLCMDSSGGIWAGGTSGVGRYSKDDGGSIVSRDERLPDIDVATALYFFDDCLFVGDQFGLYVYDFTQQKSKYHESPYPVTCFAGGSKGIIVGTSNGIFRVNFKSGPVGLLPATMTMADKVGYVNHIRIDGTVIWVGTQNEGLRLNSVRAVPVANELKGFGDDENEVKAVMKDRDGNFFAGLSGKGLAVKVAGANSYSLFPLNERSAILDNDISAICQDNEGKYWIASPSFGLVRMTWQKGSAPVFQDVTLRDESGDAVFVNDFEYDNINNGLWILSNTKLFFYDMANRTARQVRFPGSVPLSSSFSCLSTDDNGKLWLGGYGLLVIDLASYDPAGGRYDYRYFRSIVSDGDENPSRIMSIEQAGRGEVYFATRNMGIYVSEGDYDKGFSFAGLIIGGGAISSDIRSLQSDDSGNLWIGTGTGILHYDTRSHNVIRLSEDSGLSDNSCVANSSNSSCNLGDGTIAFGTENGITIIKTSFSLDNVPDRRVRITSMSLSTPKGDRRLSLGKLDDEIIIAPGVSDVGLTFSAMEYADAEDIAYAYKFDGIDDTWTYAPNPPSVVFRSMRPGRYDLRTVCTNRDGQWSHEETVTSLIVKPKFFQTMLFRVLVILLVLVAILAFFLNRYSLQKKLKAQLEKDLAKSVEAINDQNALLKAQNFEINQKKSEVEAYAANLEAISNERQQLFSNLIHEFKTPVSLILGQVERLEPTLKDVPGGEEQLSVISRNSNNILAIVNQILEAHKKGSVFIPTMSSSFNVSTFVEALSNDYLNIFKAKEHGFELLERIDSPNIATDKDALGKIVNNLLSNASKYTPDGGTIKMYAAVLGQDTPQLYISVFNTGSHIAEKEIDKLFDSFYTSDNERHFLYGQSSTGVGLYYVRNLVEALHGRITVKSDKALGTTFRVVLPVEIVEPERTEYQEIEGGGSKPVLLVAEDNADMRAHIRSILSEEYQIYEVSNGEEGYELAARLVPDFIISDLMMPGTDGLEFCRKVRHDAALAHIPFLVLTALSDDATMIASYLDGVDGFLSKPFNAEVLKARVAGILSRRSSRSEEFIDSITCPETPGSMSYDDEFRERVRSILQTRYQDPEFSATELQNELCMGSTAFFKKIKALTGDTPAHLISLYRLKVARKMLEEHRGDSSFRISEMAYSIGFSSPGYFSRCYSRLYGEKPSDTIGRQE